MVQFLADVGDSSCHGTVTPVNTPDDRTETSLQDFVNNDKKVPPDLRTRYLIGLKMSIDGSFDLSNWYNKEPFNSVESKRQFKPTRNCLLIEYKRRVPTSKNLTNRSFEELLSRL